MGPIRLEIDVAAVEHNVGLIRERCGGAKMMAVVKASAYGSDAPELAAHLAAFGVEQFAVSHTSEGVDLRRAGIEQPILVLLPTPDDLDIARRAGLTVCLHSPELVARVLADPAAVNDVHVEVDSGMHRTGLAPGEAIGALEALHAAGVAVTGLMTHLASADDPAFDDFTLGQLARFDDVTAEARRRGVPIPERHALASSGALRFPSHAMEMVRVGLALLGIAPSRDCDRGALRPALTLTSRLIATRMLRAGDAVGYGCTYVASHDHPMGTVQLGYHDGIPRSFGQGGAVVVDGRRCPVIGRVSMDSMSIDLSGCPTAEVGSEVLVFGTYGESSQPVDDVADVMHTITYEVIALLGRRVQRVVVRR